MILRIVEFRMTGQATLLLKNWSRRTYNGVGKYSILGLEDDFFIEKDGLDETVLLSIWRAGRHVVLRFSDGPAD